MLLAVAAVALLAPAAPALGASPTAPSLAEPAQVDLLTVCTGGYQRNPDGSVHCNGTYVQV